VPGSVRADIARISEIFYTWSEGSLVRAARRILGLPRGGGLRRENRGLPAFEAAIFGPRGSCGLELRFSGCPFEEPDHR
jgi:hypothetical protein